MIHSNCRRAKTGMTAEALGVSVAPSFFHTCVSEGKVARPEEVQKFKVKIWCILSIINYTCSNSQFFLCNYLFETMNSLIGFNIINSNENFIENLNSKEFK